MLPAIIRNMKRLYLLYCCILYVSDWFTEAGALASCPKKEQLLEASSGYIVSPGFYEAKSNDIGTTVAIPKPVVKRETGYPHGEKCLWRINIPKGKYLRLTAESFDTEACCDKLRVSGSDGKVLETLRGSQPEGKSYDLKVTSSYIKLDFTSDNSHSKRGFKILYHLMDCPCGTFGAGCGEKCAAGCDGSCDLATGTCRCRPGYHGPSCQKACEAGKWGKDCKNKCSPSCADPRSCSPDNGKCNDGCKSGYFGTDCSIRLAANWEQWYQRVTSGVAAVTSLAVLIVITVYLSRSRVNRRRKKSTFTFPQPTATFRRTVPTAPALPGPGLNSAKDRNQDYGMVPTRYFAPPTYPSLGNNAAQREQVTWPPRRLEEENPYN